LWSFPDPTIPSPHFAPDGDVAPNANLPQFPSGTQFALVRQMTLFDREGKLVNAPITESVQFRVYSSVVGRDEPIVAPFSYDDLAARSGQRFFEIVLSRPQFFSGKAGGLRATERDEKQFFIFGFPGPAQSLEKSPPVLKECVVCHSKPGIGSVNSRNRLLPPHQLQIDRSDADGNMRWQDTRTVLWKQRRNDWALLVRDWKAPATTR
jgi:hypothetical protein